MAEGRMIKKVLSKSKKFAALKTHNARLLYVMVYPHLDVEGRIDADPKLLKGRIIPYLNFSLQKIREYLEDMFRVGLIKLYEVNEDWYLECIKFKELQKLNPEREAKSEIPPPTPELLQRTQELLKINSRELPLKSKLSISKDNIISQIENLLRLFPTQIQNNIKIYWDRARLKNKSRVITDGRKLTMLNELHNSWQRCNDDNLFNYALEQTITHDAPCIGYVNKVWLNKKTKKPL